MGNRKCLIVTLADNNFISQAKQLFSSIYWSSGWDGDYMLLAHNIEEHDLKWFKNKGILVTSCNLVTEKPWGKNGDFFKPLIADKFYLFKEEFKKWEKIIYIDADIIVNGPLDELTKVKKFGAVNDIFNRKMHTQFDLNEDKCLLFNDFNLNRKAFNAGLFVFNTELIYPNLFNELRNFLNHYNSCLKYGEQSALNYFFGDIREELPAIYNVCVNYLNFKIPKKIKCIVLHFAKKEDIPILWDSKNQYYTLWFKNLEKADYINLKIIQTSEKWSFFKIHYFSIILKSLFYCNKTINQISFWIKYKFTPNLLYIIYTPDRIIGKIGNKIKRCNPKLYYKLKKRKDGI